MTIHLANRQRSIPINLPWLQNFANLALQKSVSHSANLLFALSKLDEIEVAIVSDRTIAKVHRDFMDIEGPTDVITFDLSAGTAGPPGAGVLAGDIVVSTETARRMARAVGWTPRQELAYYIVHGVLHLTGYNDHTAADRRQMRARERAVMKACGLPVPPRPKAAGTPR